MQLTLIQRSTVRSFQQRRTTALSYREGLLNDLIKRRPIYKWLYLWGYIEEFVLTGANRAYHEGKLDDDDWRELLELARIEFETPGMFNRVLPPTWGEGEPMLQQLVLWKEAGKVIPLNVLEQACSQYDKYEGKSLAVDGTILTSRSLGKADAAAVHEQLEQAADYPAILCFGKETTEKENIPPYELFDGAAVAFLQDDYSVWLKIKAKLDRELKNSGSFADLWAELVKADAEGNSISEIAPDIESRLSENGAIIILSVGGGVFVSDRGGLEETHEEWGYSYALKPADGGTQKEDPKTAAEPAKKAIAFGSTTANAAKTEDKKTEPSAALVAVKAGVQLSKVRADKYKMARITANDRTLFDDKYASRINENGTVSFQNQGEFFFQVPVYHENSNNSAIKRKLEKKEIQAEYLRVCGWCPENWGEHPYVPAGFLLKTADPKDSASTAALEINGKKEPIPSPNLDKAATQELVNGLWPKIAGMHHQIMGNIHKIAEQEGSVKSIAEILNKKTMAECAIPYTAHYMIAVEAPQTAARWVSDFQNFSAGLLTRIGLLENRIQELETENRTLLEAAKPKKIAFGSTAK